MTKFTKLVPGLPLLALAVMAPAAVAQKDMAQEDTAKGEAVREATMPAETAEEAIESLRQEIRQLQGGQAAIRRQLAEIKALIQKGGGNQQARRDVVPDVTLDLAGFPVQGQDDAPITVVEFADFQCPYCARYVRDTLPKLRESYIATGKVRYVAGDFPLPGHPHAFKASVAAHCAADQGKFWEMSGKLFEHSRELEPTNLPGYAAELGLDTAKFAECVESDRHDEIINRHKSAGTRASVSGTPTFLIGYTGDGGTQFKPLDMIRGAYPYDTFQQKIDALLERKAKE